MPQDESKHSHVERIVQPLARSIGSTAAILVVAGLAIIWLFTRPLFAHRQDWQDAATVPVTLLTFFLIFILQRSQNKAMLALQLKMNEIIAANHGASNRLIDLKNLPEEEVHNLHQHYQALGASTKEEDNPGQAHTVEEMARRKS